MTDEPNGRRVHHWRGENRQADIAALADAIAAAANNLFNRDGVLVQLVEGELNPVNFADFGGIIDQRICGVRAVRRDGAWWKEFYSFEFAPQVRPDVSRPGPRPGPDQSRPDAAALDHIYRHEILGRIPRAES